MNIKNVVVEVQESDLLVIFYQTLAILSLHLNLHLCDINKNRTKNIFWDLTGQLPIGTLVVLSPLSSHSTLLLTC